MQVQCLSLNGSHCSSMKNHHFIVIPMKLSTASLVYQYYTSHNATFGKSLSKLPEVDRRLVFLCKHDQRSKIAKWPPMIGINQVHTYDIQSSCLPNFHPINLFEHFNLMDCLIGRGDTLFVTRHIHQTTTTKKYSNQLSKTAKLNEMNFWHVCLVFSLRLPSKCPFGQVQY